MKVTPCTPSDFRPMVKQLGRIFKQPFPVFLPKLYAKHVDTHQYHGIVKDKGRICAVIASIPNELHLGNETITAVGIGMVGVSKKYRGKGLMKTLLEYSDTEATRHSAEIGFLGGLRQRYERRGYVPSCISYEYELNAHNLANYKHAGAYSVYPLKGHEDALPRMIEIYSSKECRWNRSSELFDKVLKTWLRRTFVIYDSEKNVFGFLLTRLDNKSTIVEVCIADDSKCLDVIKSYCKERRVKDCTCSVTCYDTVQQSVLSNYAQNTKMSTSEAIKIFDYVALLQKCMNYNNSKRQLPEGSLSIKIEDVVYTITVDDKGVTVKTGAEDFDIEWSVSHATVALTGYAPQLTSVNPLLAAWSPMCPISIPSVDQV